MKILKNIVAILLIGWFGTTCFKLGWYSRDNPFIRPLAASMLGLEDKEKGSDSGFWERMQEIFNGENNR